MANIAVAGLYNLETNLGIDAFPLSYFPVCYPFHRVSQTHAGVGFNIAVALKRLGNEVRLATLVGQDDAGRNMRAALEEEGLPQEFIRQTLSATPQAVILVDPHGRRQIHCDLKDIQDTVYPAEDWDAFLQNADVVVPCNINFTRPLLAEAQNRGKLIATDVHVLDNFDDAYNRDYLAAADILFLSHERLPCSPQAAMEELRRRYSPEIIVVGLGEHGALLSENGKPFLHQPARPLRPVVNTIGAGDAMFSAFLDQYLRLGSAPAALARAQIYAGWKIGESGASRGLLDQAGLLEKAEAAAQANH